MKRRDTRRKAVELARCFESIGRRMMQQDRNREDDGISFSRQEFRLIIEAGKAGTLTMSELAKRMTLAVSSITSIVDGLVEKNLIERVRTESDRRVVLVRLSRAGKVFFGRCERHRMRMASALLENLDDSEQDVFLELMRKISQGPVSASRGG